MNQETINQQSRTKNSVNAASWDITNSNVLKISGNVLCDGKCKQQGTNSRKSRSRRDAIRSGEKNEARNNKENVAYSQQLSTKNSDATNKNDSGLGAAKKIAIASIGCFIAIAAGTTLLCYHSDMTNEMSSSSLLIHVGPYDNLGKKLDSLSPLPTNQFSSYPFNRSSVTLKMKHDAEDIAERVRIASLENNASNNKTNDAYTVSSNNCANNAIPSTVTAPRTVQRSDAQKDTRDDSDRVVIEAEAARKQAAEQQAEEASRKAKEKADWEWGLSHPRNGEYRQCIAIGGELIPWIYYTDGCPDSCAGMWRGSGDVDDGKGSYIVGHNPGVFHNLIDMNYGVGSTFALWDINSKARLYTISDVFIVPAGTEYDDTFRKRTTNSGGETAVLQTCINNNTQYKIFVAH